MSKPGLDGRHRNKDGEISSKHGNTLVRTLRKTLSGNGNIPLVGVFTTDVDPFGRSAPSALSFDKNAPTSLSLL